MNTDDELIRRFVEGGPRERWLVGTELAQRGTPEVETKLSDLLLEATEHNFVCDLLSVLGRMRMSHLSTVDAVLVRASSTDHSVRAGAVRCLLHSSPRLAPRLRRVRELATREEVEHIREVFERLLARYPQ